MNFPKAKKSFLATIYILWKENIKKYKYMFSNIKMWTKCLSNQKRTYYSGHEKKQYAKTFQVYMFIIIFRSHLIFW